MSGSFTAVTVAVSPITSVPGAVPAPTLSTTVSVSLAPGASAPTVQVGSLKVVVPLGVVEVTLTPAGSVSTSLSVTPLAAAGP